MRTTDGHGEQGEPARAASLMTEAVFDPLLSPGEVADIFHVDPKTVTRWAAAGKIRSIKTPGGHRRFRESDVRALMESSQEAA